MTKLLGRRGVALLTALAILVVVAGMATLMFTRTLGEIRHSGDDTGIVQSLLLARGAANLGGAVLQGPVRDALDDIVQATSSTVARWSYGTGGNNSTAPTPTSVVQALTTNANSVANLLQAEIDALLCNATVPGLDGGEQLALRIYVTAASCGEALPGGSSLPAGRFVGGLPRDGTGNANDQTYGLPFVIVAVGEVGPYRRNVVTAGEYQFTVGRGSFARYALFTNVHRTAGGNQGSDVWFTENTLFDGPVHTNQNFRFYRNPWFGGQLTSAGCANPGASSCSSGAGSHGAFFFGVNAGNRVTVGQMQPPTSPSYTNDFGTHAPELPAGVDWSSGFVPLPQSNEAQRNAAIAGGIAYPRPLESLLLRATDVNGVAVPADGSVRATYQYIESCYLRNANNINRDTNLNRRVCDTYRVDASGNMVRRTVTTNLNNGNVSYDPSATGFSAAGAFNGVIFVPGAIDRLAGPDRPVAGGPASAPPALAHFAQITIAASSDITITRDLTYEDPPCSGSPTRVGGVVVPAACDDLDAQNVLGIYTQGGDVEIGHNQTGSGAALRNAPDDVTIHGILMSATGVVGVQDFNQGAPRGAVNLLGGVIEYFYGAFGTFNTSTGTMSTGYSRAFTFDRRMGAGLAPPFFPTTGDDEVRDVVAFAYSQREQVE